jgi:amino acid transporter
MFTFFVVNIWLVGMCVPSNDTDLVNASGTMGSPFVIAVKRADVYGLAHAINRFIFLSVVSCGITSVYIASRSLTALSDLQIIHPFFGRKDSQGRPYVSLIISLGLGGGLAYLNCNSVGTLVYSWFSALVSHQQSKWYVKSCQHFDLGGNSNAFPMGFDLYCSSSIPPGPPSPRQGS